MKITQDVRAYAAEHGLAEADGLQEGMKAKADDFNEGHAEKGAADRRGPVISAGT